MTATPFLSVRAVTRRHGARVVLDGISLDVERGTAVAVVGPSGSGKTSLLITIAGLDAPDQGEVWLDGGLVSVAARAVVPPHRRRIGVVFQDLALWPHMRVREQLEFVLTSGNVTRAQRPHRIRDVLDAVRIPALADRFPHQLSGGEQQRAALARALVTRPHLLLLDEPLSNLDPELRGALGAELTRLRHELQFTMIHVTHDHEEAVALADRVVALRAGRLDSQWTGGR
jgi:ABC-type Fe3+/spermidine/putrescine transport system ATPase subunit